MIKGGEKNAQKTEVVGRSIGQRSTGQIVENVIIYNSWKVEAPVNPEI